MKPNHKNTNLIDTIYTALRMACKWIRENPPGNLSDYPPELVQCLIRGQSDPEGEAYLNYFLYKAIESKKEQ